MPSKWYYEKGGVRKGPVTSEGIRRMVANGTLLPTDLLWKEGMKDWMPAAQSSNLFPIPPQAIADPKSGVDKTPTVTTSLRLTQAGSEAAQRTFKAVAGGLKGAGSLVQKQAYRTKLVQVDLPRAYTDLGEAIYAKRLQPQILASEYERIFALTQQLSDLLQSHASLPTPDDFGTRAKRLVEDANALGRRKVLETQISRAKATLGETAFAQGLDLPGCENQVAAVSKLKAMLIDADEAITALSSSREFSSICTPGRILASAAVVCVALLAWAGLSSLARYGAVAEGKYVNGSPKAPRGFEDLVSGKKREGFQMVATANPRGDSRYKFAGCQVGYRSRGNQDEVIAIVALNPLPKDMIGDGEAGAGVMITNYGQVMGLKGMFVAVLTDAASRVFREQMMYMQLPGGQQIFKDTTNGRTSFTGVLVVGNEVCTFEIPPENRRVLDNDRAFVRCGGQVITLGLSNGPEMDPRKWSAARKVLSGGRSN